MIDFSPFEWASLAVGAWLFAMIIFAISMRAAAEGTPREKPGSTAEIETDENLDTPFLSRTQKDLTDNFFLFFALIGPILIGVFLAGLSDELGREPSDVYMGAFTLICVAQIGNAILVYLFYAIACGFGRSRPRKKPLRSKPAK